MIKLKEIEIEPVGLQFCKLETFSNEQESLDNLEIEPCFINLSDFYAVLGLKKRWQATDDEIKRHYRKMALVHHPDKKANRDATVFNAIQEAWNSLSNPVKRRQFDSVDPTFDEQIPSQVKDFYKEYGDCFEKEARFSIKKPVPKLGDENSTKLQVQKFYDFWMKFESWRSFEAMDEHSTDSAESREEKRWLEKQNKASRQKLKNKDNARINKLVEQAYKADPRIQEFKNQEKLEKERRKREKREAAAAAKAATTTAAVIVPVTTKVADIVADPVVDKVVDTANAVAVEWSAKEKLVLIKAVRIFPGGAVERWEKISEYLFNHGWETELKVKRPVQECIKMTKYLQKATEEERQNLQKARDQPQETDEWSSAQQTALETALKTHPASKYSDQQDRWNAIAELVPGKSKKQVKLRVKELAELVKRKKQASS